MDEATRKAVDRIEKLMRLAGSNPNEEEAASALSKANELLVAYGLDMAVIEQASGQSGARLDEQVSGGMHKYQRELWGHIARLNFCMYWTQKTRVKPGSKQEKRGRRWTHEHRLVGRTVHVAATKGMAHYLDQTIERLCRKFLGPERSMQYYSRDAVAFREGIADRVIEKIVARRHEFELEEERKAAQAAQQAAAAGVSLATALTVASLAEKERIANYDFLNGEGAWARKLADDAEREKRWAEHRARQAEANRRAEEEYAKWAEAHPDEAKKEAAKERARERARERRRERGGGYGRYRFRQTAEEMRRDSGSYQAGYEKGDSVSIDPQMDNGNNKRIAR